MIELNLLNLNKKFELFERWVPFDVRVRERTVLYASRTTLQQLIRHATVHLDKLRYAVCVLAEFATQGISQGYSSVLVSYSERAIPKIVKYRHRWFNYG
jgi:hypothetical protein